MQLIHGWLNSSGAQGKDKLLIFPGLSALRQSACVCWVRGVASKTCLDYLQTFSYQTQCGVTYEKKADYTKTESSNNSRTQFHQTSNNARCEQCTDKKILRAARDCAQAETIFRLIDRVRVLHPTQHKTGHFGDAFPSQSLG